MDWKKVVLDFTPISYPANSVILLCEISP
uniref:Uncharacterized protein n=1 Tax=Anguilla anguilla TaxID=7936 RepID=A0A0E9TMR7_ANGAN